METTLTGVTDILARTPSVLRALLSGLPAGWLVRSEGGETFGPVEILGHLIHGEQTDWIPRMSMILEGRENEAFPPFDRVGFKHAAGGKDVASLLAEFETLRARNLDTLRAAGLQPAQLSLRGRHPDFGPVTLGQLLATWAVHDLNHIGQLVRVLGKNYADAVGPWKQYLGILNR